MVGMSEVRALTWWFFWRYSLITGLCSAAAGSAVGATIGVYMARMGYPPQSVRNPALVAGFVSGLVVSFFVANFLFAKMIGRSFSGKRLDLTGAQFIDE